jgi:uncharacterized coiled-coil protein SlyX
MNTNTLSVMLISVLTGFALSHAAQAVSPPPDGDYGNGNTAEGGDALFDLTTGGDNTAVGFLALSNNTTGNNNTATGVSALQSNTANNNTATGVGALASNTIGLDNTANGAFALQNNTMANSNTATGVDALFRNTTGGNNTANGSSALQTNTTASNNTADGAFALFSNTMGPKNTAIGVDALENNTTGGNNTAIGYLAGQNLTNGSNNIDIGANVLGNASEANTIRIGKQGTQRSTFIAGIYPTAVSGTAIVVNSNGKLGVAASSARFKEQIKPMDNVSEAILSLKPVTFRYRKEVDPDATLQFGLVAEDVDKIHPELVVHDQQANPYTVRYDAVNAMLLNEFLKEHRNVTQQQSTIAELKATVAKQQDDFAAKIAQQQKQIETLTAGLQKVSAAVELNKPAPTQVADNR